MCSDHTPVPLGSRLSTETARSQCLCSFPPQPVGAQLVACAEVCVGVARTRTVTVPSSSAFVRERWDSLHTRAGTPRAVTVSLRALFSGDPLPAATRSQRRPAPSGDPLPAANRSQRRTAPSGYRTVAPSGYRTLAGAGPLTLSLTWGCPAGCAWYERERCAVWARCYCWAGDHPRRLYAATLASPPRPHPTPSTISPTLGPQQPSPAARGWCAREAA